MVLGSRNHVAASASTFPYKDRFFVSHYFYISILVVTANFIPIKLYENKRIKNIFVKILKYLKAF